MVGEVIGFFIIKTSIEAWTVLCSVVKHLGSGRALKKKEKTLDYVSCFPSHFFRTERVAMRLKGLNQFKAWVRNVK